VPAAACGGPPDAQRRVDPRTRVGLLAAADAKYHVETVVKRGYYAALLHKLLIVIVHDDDQPVAQFCGAFHHAYMTNV
jgi:hypothetical protein